MYSSSRRWNGYRIEKSRWMDCRGRLGICIRRALDGSRRIFDCWLPENQRARCDHRRRRRLDALSGSSDLTIQLIRAGVNFKF